MDGARAVRRAVVLLGVALVLGALASIAWIRLEYHQWTWWSLPDRIGFCGRFYLGPGDTETEAQLRREGAHLIGHLSLVLGRREVWGVRAREGGAECGTVVFVRSGSSFRAYALSGGP